MIKTICKTFIGCTMIIGFAMLVEFLISWFENHWIPIAWVVVVVGFLCVGYQLTENL